MAAKVLGLIAAEMLTTTPSIIYRPSATRWATVNVTFENQEAVLEPGLYFAVVDSSYVSGTPNIKYMRESGNPVQTYAPIVLTGVPLGPEQAIVAWLDQTANVSIAVEGIEEDV